MANGIGSVEIVEAMGRHGFLGIFGSAGLPLGAVEQAIDRIQRGLGDSIPYGMNLIHSPGEPELEAAVVDLLPAAAGAAGRGIGVPEPDVAGGPLSRGGPPPRRVGAGRRAESDHRQGLAGRGGFQVHGSAAGPDPPRAGRHRRDHGRASGVGDANSDGRGHHGRGRFRGAYRQPAGDRAVADDADPARSDVRRSTATTGRSASGRPAASRPRGRRRRPWRWARPTW